MNEPNATAYPLAWPSGKPRTKPSQRKGATFHTTDSVLMQPTAGGGAAPWRRTVKRDMTVATAVARLRVELERMRALRVVVSTNVELRADGMPRSNRRAPDDPGVAVYFRLGVNGDPVTLACDRYLTVADNITAIAKHIGASRAIERYGVGTLRDIFRGYTALPPAVSPDDWRTVLNDPPTLAHAEAYYRQAVRNVHPDVSGSETEMEMVVLNAAIAAARKAFAQ